VIFIDVLGFLTLSLLIVYILWCAIWKNAYRAFNSRWFGDIFSTYTYINPARCWYQRMRYGYSSDDVWSFDLYLLKLLPRALAEIRDSDMRSESISDKDWEDMIMGITNYKHIYACYDLQCPYSHNIFEQDFKKAMGLLTKHFTSLWI
jgi:hypothetical protein